MGMRQLFWGSTPLKLLAHGHASVILAVYTPQIIGAWACANYFWGLHPPRNWRMGMRQLFGGSTPPKYLAHGHAPIILGV